jgi:hypothetical protein
MISRSRALAAAVLAASLASMVPALGVPDARAQNNAVIAESLYQEAQKLMGEGKIEQACEKFAASHKLDPAPGTVLNLAACQEKLGKLASAWASYKEAQSLAARRGDKRREDYSAQKIEAIEKRLHRIVIEILSPLPSMEVKLDDHPLIREAWGTGIALDPGEHTIEVTAPGYKKWTRKLNMGPSSGTDRIEVPKLEKDEATTPEPTPIPTTTSTTPTPPAPTTAPTPQPPAQETSKPMSAETKRTIGLVVGGVGVASLITSVVFGIRTLGLASDRDSLCPSGTPCFNQAAFDADHDARVSQQWMLITGGAGLVLGGVGAFLFFTAKDPQPTTTGKVMVLPGASPRGGSVNVVGRF